MSSSTAPSSLYVGNLHPDVNEHFLYELFRETAQIASIYICRNSINNESLGYAYVNLTSPQDAKKIIDQCNHLIIQDRQIRIMYANRDPGLRKSGVGNLFVKNLSKEIDSKALEDVFSQYGEILSCHVRTSKDEHGNLVSNGYGYVHFQKPEDAEAAMEALNGKFLNDQQIQVTPYKTKEERPNKSMDETFTNVYVKNLPTSFDDAELKKLFEQFGEVQNATVAVDSEKKSKGFGFVNFVQHEDAKKAIDELNGKNIEESDKEKLLVVNRFQTKEERQKLLKQEKLNKAPPKQETNLYVRHFPDDFDEEKLRELFAPFGEIKSVHIMRDQKKKTSRGFGFVCFAKSEDASNAINQLHGKMLSNNKPLFVALHQPKSDRKSQIDRIRREQSVQLMYQGAPLAYPPYIQPMMFPQNLMWPQPQMGAPMATEEDRKQEVGNYLYSLVQKIDPENAAKITGMFLELDEKDIGELISDSDKLHARVQEALAVLKNGS